MSCLSNICCKCIPKWFCNICCCQCNCIIFPVPDPLDHNSLPQFTNNVKCQSLFFQNKEQNNVPYLKISTEQFKKSSKCFIYFHGNAQDIGGALEFLESIVSATNVVCYAIEYPSYGKYTDARPFWISDRIKSNAQDFYKYLRDKNGLSTNDILIMGRSIGSGGAVYLASKVNSPALILISPFDSIHEVAQNILPCCCNFLVCCFLKNHFDNVKEIQKYRGKLLVIHGKRDQVIPHQNGQHLVQVFNHLNIPENTATFNSPPYMTHNSFDINKDIVNPIERFLNGFLKKQSIASSNY